MKKIMTAMFDAETMTQDEIKEGLLDFLSGGKEGEEMNPEDMEKELADLRKLADEEIKQMQKKRRAHLRLVK